MQTKQMVSTGLICHDCHNEIVREADAIGTGYGVIDNETVCYECCGKRDREMMRTNNRITLYLNIIETQPTSEQKRQGYGVRREFEVINWPGTLRIRASGKSGRHNIAGVRYDVWFTINGDNWHGVQYGDNTQILHCRKLKA